MVVIDNAWDRGYQDAIDGRSPNNYDGPNFHTRQEVI